MEEEGGRGGVGEGEEEEEQQQQQQQRTSGLNEEQQQQQQQSTSGLSEEQQQQQSMTGLSEEDALKNLTGSVRDQNDLERDITLQANAALVEAEDKKDTNRIDKLDAARQRLQLQLDKEKKQLERVAGNPYQSRKVQKEIARLDEEVERVKSDIADFQARITKRHQENPLESTDQAKSKRLAGESHRDYLIRTGKITPFAKIGGARPQDLQGSLADSLLDAEDEAAANEYQQETSGPTSHQSLRRPGFADEIETPKDGAPADTARVPATAAQAEFSLRPRKKRRVEQQRQRSPSADFEPEQTSAESDAGPLVWQQGTDEDLVREQRRKTKSKDKARQQEEVDLSSIDDGNEAFYKKRLEDWVTRRSRARRARRQAAESGAAVAESDGEEEEWFKPSPDYADHYIDHGLKLPGDIHPSLFGYQKTGVQWLAELYKQGVGGIVGDEMGLGKTVQLIAFIAALHCSAKLKRPVIVVAPATLLRQWVSEFHRWWPPLRVAILHSSGSGMMNARAQDEDDVDTTHGPVAKKSLAAARKIVKGVVEKGHVLVTTYTGLQTYADELLPVAWEYAVLDEGHKIRNPNAEMTVTCKELNTPNRIILSGTPVQNNLTELWSLFDFIYPMRLGTLVNFRAQFEIPIRQGGYANASNLQVMTAEKCAEALKETIGDYLLQRLKVDVAADLPAKTEQVLFCKLTESQREAYETFLSSDEVSAILSRRRQSLYGIDILRKICNHPDLLDKSLARKAGYNFGHARLSAKLQLTRDLVEKVMIPNGHKTLLFSQGKLMLNIIEKSMREQGISYLRMDGETPVDQRQPMIDRFNTDPSIHVFLMTTRTGGLGTNLTGADRIIIFDPDWNPSTDLQARERAWRLGQNKPVKIYRLMTEGTIEEKIYHRQIFKQFMTNKVLKDPKQRSSYDLSDLYDLFSYSRGDEAAHARSDVFKGAQVSPAAADLPDQEAASVQHIKTVAAVEAYPPGQDDAAHDERRMLQGIFARSVKSAYDHEQIVGGGQTTPSKLAADVAVLRHEADEMGRLAAAHLSRAAEDARRVPIGTVTWTGEVGEAGRPGRARRRARGPGSAAVLSNLAERQGLRGSGGAQTQTRDYGALIKAFVARHGGQVPSKMLVDHFNPLCPGKKQSDEFKMALDRIAVLKRGGAAGRGMWSLKPGVN
ncbi:hypothetical protein CDD81_3710 [Ophiocordyceps australis]|uniref:DNA repair protein Rhp26/Rad26 n=1 Tax=Ophiocordyceps australis TaxID=1399860 RepID=A0A2C5XWP8_9HYPO|nr:hypothetical protein CDD81_3710 [Ophiocordyceps australis]